MHGHSLLYLALRKKQLEMAQLLINKGADIQQNLDFLLKVLINCDRIEVIQFVFEQFPDIISKLDAKGIVAQAAGNISLAFFTLLLNIGCKPDIVSSEASPSVLYTAITQPRWYQNQLKDGDRLEILKQLLEQK